MSLLFLHRPNPVAALPAYSEISPERSPFRFASLLTQFFQKSPHLTQSYLPFPQTGNCDEDFEEEGTLGLIGSGNDLELTSYGAASGIFLSVFQWTFFFINPHFLYSAVEVTFSFSDCVATEDILAFIEALLGIELEEQISNFRANCNVFDFIFFFGLLWNRDYLNPPSDLLPIQ